MNPSRGTIRIVLGSADEGTDLPTEHDLAPWPTDQHCERIASEALSGMGWKVTKSRPIPRAPDGDFVLDVAPSSEDAADKLGAKPG